MKMMEVVAEMSGSLGMYEEFSDAIADQILPFLGSVS